MKQTYSEGLFMWYRICITDVMMKIIEPMINPTEKNDLDIDSYHLRLFYCYCFSAECPNIIQCLKICFQEDVFVLHCFFCEYPKIQFGLVGLLHTYNEPEPSLG